jgi:hypothetical protein
MYRTVDIVARLSAVPCMRVVTHWVKCLQVWTLEPRYVLPWRCSMTEQLIAKLTYTCPNRNQTMTVGPEDYEVGAEIPGGIYYDGYEVMSHEIKCTVNCLCGSKHELRFGEGE